MADYNGQLTGAQIDALPQMIDELNAAVFPLTVSWASGGNAGTYEEGTEVIPTAIVSCKRKGSDVSSSATITCSGATVDGTTVTAPAKSTGSLTLNASVTQGGQTATTGNKSWTWSYYRYKGAIDSIPTDYKATIEAMSSTELSTTSTLGDTELAANKYFLFAVKGTPTLKCRDAAMGGEITGCPTGTVSIARTNGKGSDTYTYILVPKSSINWKFRITNS